MVYACQHPVQNLCSQERDNVSVWVSSKQIGQTKGSGSTGVMGFGDSRLAFEVVEMLVAEAESATAERRVTRLIPLESERLL